MEFVSGKQLKIVSTVTVGYDHIDVMELKKRGIKFSNAPNVVDESVADVGILLALAASRRLQEGNAAIKKCVRNCDKSVHFSNSSNLSFRKSNPTMCSF